MPITTSSSIASLKSALGDYINYPHTATAIQSPIIGQINGGGTGGGNHIISHGGTTILTGGPSKGVYPHKPVYQNHVVENGKKFEDCSELFVCNFDVTDEIMSFHYSVWIKNFGEILSDYGTIARQFSYEKAKINDYGYVERNRTFVAFGSQSTKDHFLSWLENYRNVFYANVFMEDTLIPELVSTRKISGIFVIDNVEKDITPQALQDYVLDSWAWIVSHCYNPVVRVSNTGWLFSNDAEAIHFKMRD